MPDGPMSRPSVTKRGGYQGSFDPGEPTRLMQPQTVPVGHSDDPATARVERARAREAAGWNPRLVSALNILEYGCDEGDYDAEVAAVTNLAEAALAVVDAANKGYVYAAHPALLTLEAALDGD